MRQRNSNNVKDTLHPDISSLAWVVLHRTDSRHHLPEPNRIHDRRQTPHEFHPRHWNESTRSYEVTA
jgi:hypothetical protein